MLTTIKTFKTVGINAVPVTVECSITPGIGIHLVGLADAAVKESLLRTVTAMQALGYRIPGKKIIINLAPADIVKSGSTYDLAIALATIAASDQEQLSDTEQWLVAGELGLDGSIRPVPGCIQAFETALHTGDPMHLIIPAANANEITRTFDAGIGAYAASNLGEAISIIADRHSHPTIWEDPRSDSKKNKTHKTHKTVTQ